MNISEVTSFELLMQPNSELAEPQPLYTLTAAAVGAKAGTSSGYVVVLAKKRAIPFVTASNGLKLFSEAVIPTVARLKREGWSRRGVRRKAAANQSPDVSAPQSLAGEVGRGVEHAEQPKSTAAGTQSPNIGGV